MSGTQANGMNTNMVASANEIPSVEGNLTSTHGSSNSAVQDNVFANVNLTSDDSAYDIPATLQRNEAHKVPVHVPLQQNQAYEVSARLQRNQAYKVPVTLQQNQTVSLNSEKVRTYCAKL